MRKAYRILAYLVAIEVAIQAAAMVYAIAGLTYWIGEEGGTLNEQTFENSQGGLFPEEIGFAIHAINGTMLIPLLVLLLLVTSFFTKVKGATKWALGVLGLVVLQVFLGIFLHGITGLGALHGLNALALFSVAVYAGRRTRDGSEVRTGTDEGDRAAVRVT